MARPRIALLDTARVLTALLVVVGHLLPMGKAESTLYIYIYQFHMPLFFFISGMLDKPGPFVPYMGKQARLLLIPLISFSMVALVERLLHIGSDVWPMAGDSMEALFASKVIKLAPTVWFLLALFHAKWLAQAVRRLPWMAGCMLWVVLLITTYYFNPLFMASAVMVLPIYLAGFYGKALVLRLAGQRWFGCIWPLCFAVVWLVMSWNGRVSTNAAWYGHGAHGLYPHWMLSFYLSAMSGTMGVLSLASLVRKPHRWIQTFAESLITVMCFQYVLIRLLRHVLFPSPLWFRLLASAVILVGCVAVHQLMMRYAPFMLGRRRKKRET